MKIDESALDDWRIALLAKRLGTTYAEALLVCLRVWRRLYNRGGGVMAPEEIDAVAGRDGVATFMVECSLADAVPDGFRIKGEERAKEFSYYRQSQSEKGKKRQSGKGADKEPAGAEPGLSRGLAGAEPVISISDSESVSASGSGSGSGEQGQFKLVVVEPEHPRRAEALRLWELQDRLRLETCPGARKLHPTEERLQRVIERLEDHSYEDCEHVLHVYADECRSKPESRRWFDGVTPWREDNFDRAAGRPRTSTPSAAPDRAWLAGGTRRNS